MEKKKEKKQCIKDLVDIVNNPIWKELSKLNKYVEIQFKIPKEDRIYEVIARYFPNTKE